MEVPQQAERHDKMVWETPTMDALRHEHCMCLHCGALKPGTPENCPIAQKFYEICKAHGNAFILTRCEDWIPDRRQKTP